MSIRPLLAMAALTVASVWGQLAPPNEAGVTLGHIHLVVKDLDAQKHFWIDMMGGKLVHNGPIELIQFPGVFIMLRKATEPTESPEGAFVNHPGFIFKDLPARLALWKANGVKFEGGDQDLAKVLRLQGFVFAPDGIRVEFFGDPSLLVPVQMEHIHNQVVGADVPAIQAWYAKVLGGTAGTRLRNSKVGSHPVVLIPGAVFILSESFPWSQPGTNTRLAPTKGRSIDHIGFEVTNLDAFTKKLETEGIKLDVPIRKIPNTNIKVAFLTDPWGTYIELTENLAPTSK